MLPVFLDWIYYIRTGIIIIRMDDSTITVLSILCLLTRAASEAVSTDTHSINQSIILFDLSIKTSADCEKYLSHVPRAHGDVLKCVCFGQTNQKIFSLSSQKTRNPDIFTFQKLGQVE